MGGDLGVNGPCIRSPNISRSSVIEIGCVPKYELTKNGEMEDFFLNKGFSLRKGSYM